MPRRLPRQPDRHFDFGFLDSVRLHTLAIQNVGKYEQDKDRLVRHAKAGDVGALILLWERFRVRLPAVEGRMTVTFPWMGR